MTTKLNHLGELEQVLCSNESTDKGVLDFYSQFKISCLLAPFEVVKKKGFKVSSLIVFLCLFRLRGLTIHAMQHVMNKISDTCDDNCFYRLMNNPRMDWRRLLLSFAKQFQTIVQNQGDENHNVKCFIIDDTLLNKTGKTIEHIGRVFDHCTKKYVLGFKLLVLGFWDGKSLIATDFSLHCEKSESKNYGMSKKERKNQFRKKRPADSPSQIRKKELNEKKNSVAVKMIKRAVKKGFMASYVLMDSWFTCDMIISSIRSIKNGAIHILGLCKIDGRKYLLNGKRLNSHQIITRNERKKSHYSRKHKSHYMTVLATYKGERVKLFYIKYQSTRDWKLLLTTDLRLEFVKALELYQIRWTIEVLFKECKQYLGLGRCQNTDFDGQLADTTIVLVTHTILTLKRRFEAYETMGGLFRQTQHHLIELTLWERILKVFIKVLQRLFQSLNVDIEEVLEKILQDDEVGKRLYLVLVLFKELEDNPQYKLNVAA